MIDPKSCVIYYPAYRRGPKRAFVQQLGTKFGGFTVKPDLLAKLPPERIPVIGCYPEVAELKREWDRDGRPYIYRDNGYFRRANWRGRPNGYWRWHWNATQLRRVTKRPGDRLDALKVSPMPWRRDGRHILVATPGWGYAALFGLSDWTERTLEALRKATDRPVIVRGKGSTRPFHADLEDAWALVTHGSVAAVEAAVMGIPVFVDAESAAAHVGKTDLAKIETPARPDRAAWLRALAYSQFNLDEMLNGAMWRIFGSSP